MRRVLPSGAMSTLPKVTPIEEPPAVLPLADETLSQPATRAIRFAALHSPNFRLLWIGLLISNAGTWMEATASNWLVTDLKPRDDAFWLGLLAAAFAIPMLILPPFGGAIADRVPRMTLLWTVQILYLTMASALALVVLTDLVAIWMLLVYAFLNGIVLAFDSPVRHAMLPDIVTRDQLSSGVSLNSVAFTGAALVGPAIAGVLIPLIGIGGVMTINAASCIATLVALSQMRDVPSRRHVQNLATSIIGSIKLAIAYIRSSPLLSGLVLLSGVAGLTGRSYGPLLAVFARDEYRVGSTAFGAMVSAGGLGTLIGAFGLAGRKEVVRKGHLIAFAYMAQASMLLAFAVLPWYATSLPLLAAMGICNAIAGATISTVIQLSVPGELRGRVMSLYLLTVVGIPSVGSFVFGALAEPLGVRAAVALAASTFLAASAFLLAQNRTVREAR